MLSTKTLIALPQADIWENVAREIVITPEMVREICEEYITRTSSWNIRIAPIRECVTALERACKYDRNRFHYMLIYAGMETQTFINGQSVSIAIPQADNWDTVQAEYGITQSRLEEICSEYKKVITSKPVQWQQASILDSIYLLSTCCKVRELSYMLIHMGMETRNLINCSNVIEK